MKFVQTLDGTYLNVRYLEQFNVNMQGAVVAYYHEGKDCYALANGFKSREEAQEWLDELIDKLERGDD